MSEQENRARESGARTADDAASAQDRIGTLRYITPAKILEAAGLVRKGQVISLNAPLDAPPPMGSPRPAAKRQPLYVNKPMALGDSRYAIVNDDVIEFALQGSSHWDALAHFGVIERDHPGVFYGGRGLEECADGRAATIGADAFAGGIVTRGVILDLVRVSEPLGASYLAAGSEVTTDTLTQALADQAVQLRRGDAVLLFTGYEARSAASNLSPTDPGLDPAALELFAEAQVAALVADNRAIETHPRQHGPLCGLHARAIKREGMLLGELWALQELMNACHADNVYEFLLVSAPLNVAGAFGSPANALAVR